VVGPASRAGIRVVGMVGRGSRSGLAARVAVALGPARPAPAGALHWGGDLG